MASSGGGGAAGGFVTRAFEAMLKESSSNKKLASLQTAIRTYLDSAKDLSQQSIAKKENHAACSDGVGSSSPETDGASAMGKDSLTSSSTTNNAEHKGTAESSGEPIATALANAGHTLGEAETEIVLNPIRLAFETKNMKIVELALDCLHGHWNLEPQFHITRMTRFSQCQIYFRLMFGTRMYSSRGASQDITDVIKKISKILMSCPKLGLDTVLEQNGIRASPEVVEEVIKKFENAGTLAYRFFEWADRQRHYEHTVKTFHYMIESLAKVRQYQIMWDLVNNMRKKGLLNIETFCIIMRRYARAHKVEEAVYTFNVMEKYDVTPNLAAFNGLLGALCKSKNVRKAQEIFDTMKFQFVPDSKTYSILLEGWGREPNLPRARELFSEMERAGCEPDIVTYGIMVDILCKTCRVEEAVGIIKEMNSRGIRPTSFIYSVLIHTYGLDNRIEDAVDTFLEMEQAGIEADVAAYNALISAFCKVNRMQNVYRVLNEMDGKQVKPNSRTCNIILSSLILREDTDEAFKVFRKMIRICEPDADTYTMMIKMFCGRDELEMALKIWKYMKTKQFVPSMHTFSVLVEGLCGKGDVSEACVLMEEMIERGIRPGRHTFGKLRQLLLKEGRKDVLEFLNEKMNLLVKEPLCD